MASLFTAPSWGQVTAEPFKKSGIYDVGEKAGWTLTLPAGATTPAGPYRYTIKVNNADTFKQGELELSSGRATLEFTFNNPGMAYVQITPPAGAAAATGRGRGNGGRGGGGAGGGLTLGAAIAPEKIGPAVPKPADFDAFWEGKLKALKAVPINPQLAPIQGNDKADAFTYQLDSLNSKAHGYMAKPKKEGKFPALVIYQYAGTYALKPEDVLTRATEGWLALDEDSHDKLPSEAQGSVPANYQAVGNTDKETSYFLNMYLRDARVIDYVTSLPEWDGKTLVLWGISMGGQQSLVTAALRNDVVTAVVVNVPAGADSNGDLHGRKQGYPNWDSRNPKVMETGLYFDTVNFAPKIKAPTVVALGFIDTTCYPVGQWAMYNQIPGPKEVIPMIESDHNHITPEKQGAWNARNKEVLDTIRAGKELKLNGISR